MTELFGVSDYSMNSQRFINCEPYEEIKSEQTNEAVCHSTAATLDVLNVYMRKTLQKGRVKQSEPEKLRRMIGN